MLSRFSTFASPRCIGDPFFVAMVVPAIRFKQRAGITFPSNAMLPRQEGEGVAGNKCQVQKWRMNVTWVQAAGEEDVKQRRLF